MESRSNVPHFKRKCVEHNKEGLFAKKECKEHGPKGRLSKLRARGERQLRRAMIKRFREEGRGRGKLFLQTGKCNKPGLFPRRISENSIPLSKFLKILLTTSA